MKYEFLIWIVLKYIFLICVHNFAKETCARTTELLTEFDGVQEGSKEGYSIQIHRH